MGTGSAGRLPAAPAGLVGGDPPAPPFAPIARAIRERLGACHAGCTGKRPRPEDRRFHLSPGRARCHRHGSLPGGASAVQRAGQEPADIRLARTPGPDGRGGPGALCIPAGPAADGASGPPPEVSTLEYALERLGPVA